MNHQQPLTELDSSTPPTAPCASRRGVVGQFEARASLELDYVAVRVRHVSKGMVRFMLSSP